MLNYVTAPLSFLLLSALSFIVSFSVQFKRQLLSPHQ